MGISLTASLLRIHGLLLPAQTVLLLGWAIFLTLIVGWFRYRSPRFESGVLPAWGMVAMGMMSLGSATSGIFGGLTWWIHCSFWLLGSTLSVITCLGYTRLLVTTRAGSPTFSWGLPLVAPMVAATTGALVYGRLLLIDAPPIPTATVLAVSGGLFCLAVVLAPPVFGYVYLQILGPAAGRSGTDPLPAIAAPTAWIPLGLIGQSTAAAQFLAPGVGWPELGVGYGSVALLLGLPLAGWALWRHYRVAWRIRYNPTWWAATFPVGTCCLGSHALAVVSGTAWLDVLSAGLLILLLGHVTWAGFGFLRAVRRQAQV